MRRQHASGVAHNDVSQQSAIILLTIATIEQSICCYLNFARASASAGSIRNYLPTTDTNTALIEYKEGWNVLVLTTIRQQLLSSSSVVSTVRVYIWQLRLYTQLDLGESLRLMYAATAKMRP